MTLHAVNPATGETIATYQKYTSQEVAAAIDRAHLAYLSWRDKPLPHRAELMREVARHLRQGASEYAELMAREMGKPVRQGRSEVEKCAWVCDYYADHAARFLAPEPVETDARRSFVTFRPVGIVLAIMPWNFPFWQIFRAAAPALMAGNAMLLKHASNVPGCALAIEELFARAGFPAALFHSLLIESDQVAPILEHDHVAAVTLTGSTPAGRAVAGKAGDRLKKSVLELGGSDPYLILEDADLAAAVETCVTSRLINSGQSCIAAKRFIVVGSLREPFEEGVIAHMRQKVVGDPLEEDTDVGPLARRDLRDDLHRQVSESVRRGATLRLGGEIPAGGGSFYPPTVLTAVGPGMPAHDEELFGPVAAIIPVRDEAQAIEVANNSPFGLGAAVFTRDIARGEQIAAEKLQAGCCFVNAIVRSDPRLPFGGIKESGYGRELSQYGIKEFVNIKTVYVA